jgi:iduronate 2-sulfatase
VRELTRREFMGIGLAGAAGMMLRHPLASLFGQAATGAEGYNVLFIPVDDLRPTIGCYGAPVIQTPNLDRLAAEGTVFTRAYCQQAVCSPSRTSLLTGLRPDTTRVYDLQTHFRDTIPDVVTLPEQFKAQGYHTQGMGKVYHGGLDDAQSWSVPHWRPRCPTWLTEENTALMKRLRDEVIAAGKDPKDKQNQVRGYPWEAPECEDNALHDGALADSAIEALGEIKGRPFFLAAGFIRPHLPFVAPKRYWDLYDPDDIELAGNPFAPQDAPQYALTNWGELRSYYGIPKQGPVTDEQARTLIHGYYAASSFTDAQIGRLMDELQRLGLWEKTIVIMWGDHGWHLGDHGLWCKHTNFESAVHSPLIIRVPGQQPAKCDALVEFVDICPSLCELCGVPLPEGLEGTSFAPLIEDPMRPWKTAAFSQYPRRIRNVGSGMGHSMRTDRYRLTDWTIPDTDFREYELYDHEVDPKENVNIARLPENAELVRQLAEQLHAGWEAALPPE